MNTLISLLLYILMPAIVNSGGELIRISPKSATVLEYSKDNGRSWYRRYSASSSVGSFIDLLDIGTESLAITTKGVYYSKDSGRSWYRRYAANSSTGDFINLTNAGSELLATTSKGLYYSRDNGRSWYKRK